MSTDAPFSWDSPTFGVEGHNVHHATTDDVGSDRQPHGDRERGGDDQ